MYNQQRNYGIVKLKESARVVADFKKGRFFGFRREYCQMAMELGSAFAIYVYMTSWITTDSKTTHKIWKEKVTPYFLEGHLPFCKNLTNIRDDFKIQKMNRMKITRWLQQLETKGLIKQIGEEWIGNSFRPAKVYCLGTWTRDENDNIVRIYKLDEIVGIV